MYLSLSRAQLRQLRLQAAHRLVELRERGVGRLEAAVRVGAGVGVGVGVGGRGRGRVKVRV